MKRILIILFALAAFPIAMTAQNKEINDILDKYEKRKSVESVTISSDLLAMAGKGNDWGGKISKIRIVSVDSNVIENNVPIRVELKRDMDELVLKFKFISALKVKDGNEEVEMYINQNKSGALLFLNSSKEEFAVIAMFGNIDDKLIQTALKGGISIK
jgi:hypothetical protein